MALWTLSGSLLIFVALAAIPIGGLGGLLVYVRLVRTRVAYVRLVLDLRALVAKVELPEALVPRAGLRILVDASAAPRDLAEHRPNGLSALDRQWAL